MFYFLKSTYQKEEDSIFYKIEQNGRKRKKKQESNEWGLKKNKDKWKKKRKRYIGYLFYYLKIQ